MAHTIESFSKSCHDILKADPGPDGRARVRDLLQEALKDDGFVAAHFGPDNTEPRKCLYEDPELGFCIFAHVHTGAKTSEPHDHGDSWAIYGQADGLTVMSEWEKVAAPQAGEPGRVRLKKQYEMRRGDAYLYNVGDLHSPRRDGPTKLVRIEGRNLDHVKRDKYAEASAAAE